MHTNQCLVCFPLPGSNLSLANLITRHGFNQVFCKHKSFPVFCFSHPGECCCSFALAAKWQDCHSEQQCALLVSCVRRRYAYKGGGDKGKGRKQQELGSIVLSWRLPKISVGRLLLWVHFLLLLWHSSVWVWLSSWLWICLWCWNVCHLNIYNNDLGSAIYTQTDREKKKKAWQELMVFVAGSGAWSFRTCSSEASTCTRSRCSGGSWLQPILSQTGSKI